MITIKNKLTISFLIAVLILSAGSAFARPHATWRNVTADFSTLTDYLTVACTDNSTGRINSWYWDFGDGSTSNQQNPTHVYSVAGSYQITLTVSWNRWSTDSASKLVSVSIPPASPSPPPTLPVASYTASPTSGEAPLTVNFADHSSNATGLLWKFGDGYTSTAENPKHVYAQAGKFVPTLTATNSAGQDTVNDANIEVIDTTASPSPPPPSPPPPSLTGSVYYVDSAYGSDSASGLSVGEAWRTIAKVNRSVFNPGDQILFKRGDVWYEQLTVPSSGTSGNPVVFGAYGSGDKPKIWGSAAGTETAQRANAVNGVSGVSYVTLDNLDLRYTTQWVVDVNRGQTHWTIQNCDISQGRYAGIRFNAANDGAAIGNKIDHTGNVWTGNTDVQSGLVFDSVNGGLARSNIIHHTARTGIAVIGGCSNVIVEYNDISYTGLTGTHGYGIQLYPYTAGVAQTNTIVRYNYCHNDGNIDLYILNEVDNLQAYYNIFDNPKQNGPGGDWFGNIVIDATVGGTCKNAKFYNNTCYMDNVSRNGFNIRVITQDNARMEGAVFKNNIFRNLESGQLAMSCPRTQTTPPVFNNNCYWLASHGGTIINYENANYSLSTFRSVKGQELQGMENAPDFVAENDFHLQSSSPCIDAGANVNLTKDDDGTPVPQGHGPDIGTYEYH
jgi:PKD repeat protein